MPAPILEANYAFVDGDWSLATAVGRPHFSQPFNGDNGEYVLEQDFQQYTRSFAALTLNAVHPFYNGVGQPGPYYLTGEGPLQDIGGGTSRWTRTYCMIPNARSDIESYAAQLPGLGVGGTNPYDPIKNYTVATVTISGQPIVLTTVNLATPYPGGWQNNDFITIYYRAVIAGGYEQQFVWFGQVFDNNADASGQSFRASIQFTQFLNLSAIKMLFVVKTSGLNGFFGRKPLSRVVKSRIDYQYFNLGVTSGVAVVDDIPLLSPVYIFDQFNQQTDTYTPLTTPRQQDYVTQINAKTWIVAEESVPARWKGNIYERRTRYIVAA